MRAEPDRASIPPLDTDAAIHVDVRCTALPGAPHGAYHRRVIPPRLLLAVAAGGAVGAVLRHLAGDAVPDGDGFPGTTFAVNVLGAALLAALPLLPRVRRSRTWAAGLGPGLLGGFTTLSATSEQGRALLAGGHEVLAAAYLLGTLGASLMAVTILGRLAPPLTEEDER